MLASMLCIFGAYLLLWLLVKHHFRYWQRRRIAHNRPRIPTGNMHDWLRKKHSAQIFGETYFKFKGSGPYAGFYFNTKRAVIVLDLDLAKSILVRDFEYFERRGFFHNEKDDPLTGNLFLLDGAKWRSLRPRLATLFTMDRMKFLYNSVLDVGEEFQRVFNEKVRESQDGFISIGSITGRFTTDVIGSCAFGLNCNSMRNPHTIFYVMARNFFGRPRHNALIDSLINCFPDWAKFCRMKIIPDDVTNFYMRVFKQNATSRPANHTGRGIFLDLLMSLKNQMAQMDEENITLEELTAQAFSFFITAFDTCSSTISFALLELAHNQEIQATLRREIVQTLHRHRRKLTFECLMSMNYLDQVISETLRKYPVSPALYRKCTKRYTPSNKHYYIEKGCTIIIPTLSYHQDPEYFPDPGIFDPERFSPSNVQNIREFSYMPFGGGPRNCVGRNFGLMLIKIAIVKLLTNFRFDICPKTKVPVEIVVRSFNLHPLDITLKVTKV